MNHKRPELKNMTFDCGEKYSEYCKWYKLYHDTSTEGGRNMVVQTIDYLANPAILKKNDNLIAWFCQSLPKIGDNLKPIQAKLDQLKNTSYNIAKSLDNSIVDKIEDTSEFFDNEAETVGKEWSDLKGKMPKLDDLLYYKQSAAFNNA